MVIKLLKLIKFDKSYNDLLIIYIFKQFPEIKNMSLYIFYFFINIYIFILSMTSYKIVKTIYKIENTIYIHKINNIYTRTSSIAQWLIKLKK